MVSQAWSEEGKILIDRASNGVEVWGLVGRNTVFPKEVIETVIPNIDRLEKSGKIKRKMLNAVKLAVYISDSQSAMILPDMKGEIDMSTLLVGANQVLSSGEDLEGFLLSLPPRRTILMNLLSSHCFRF
jgi:hypothetical protein